MHENKHSKIILNEHSVNALIKWLLMQDQENAVKNIKVTHEKDHLHLKVGINYNNVPGVMDIPFIGKVHPVQKLLGNFIEGDLYLSLRGHHVKGKIDFHGLASVMQGAIRMLGIDSVFFFFAPHWREINGLRINGPYDIDFDLSSLNIPDGNIGNSELTDIVKFHSLSVGDKHEEMLIADFSII
ncbi:MAG: hypothetical protein WAX69_23580 [Victivallales bacterium]